MAESRKAASQKAASIFDREFEDEGSMAKLIRKARDAPFMPAGILGGLLAVTYGIYKYRHRGNMSTSIYLIHMRLAAQGAVVSALSVGVAYTLYKDYIATPSEAKTKTEH